jgi:hypothetical protein
LEKSSRLKVKTQGRALQVFVCLVIALLGLSACQQTHYSDKAAPQAIQGVLDLRDWDFARDGTVVLAGEWAFYWQELLLPDQIQAAPAIYVPVPNGWDDYAIGGETLPTQGYATFKPGLYRPSPLESYSSWACITSVCTLFDPGTRPRFILPCCAGYPPFVSVLPIKTLCLVFCPS